MSERTTPASAFFDKLERSGAQALSDTELIGALIQNELPDSQRERVSSLLESDQERLARMSYADLAGLPDLTAAQAAALAAGLELGRRLFGQGEDLRPRLDRPQRVWAEVSDSVRKSRKEHFVAFYLDSRNRLLSSETVSVGTLSASLVHPREVFSPAIQTHAAALIVAHNHPSGDCEPSSDDKETTGRLARSGELLGILLLDHLIVTRSRFFSFKEHGLL